MPRQTPVVRGKSPNVNYTNVGTTSRAQRASLSSSASPHRNPSRLRAAADTGSSSRGSRLNSTSNPPIIMTKAQLRRKNAHALVVDPSNTIRTVLPAESDLGPIVTTVADESNANQSRASNNKVAANAASRLNTGTRVTLKPTSLRKASVFAPNANSPPSAITTAVVSHKNSRRTDVLPTDNQRIVPSSVSFYRTKRSRHRVTFDLPSIDSRESVSKVLTSEKILPRILSLMNWNELLPLRTVCKAWFEMIESQPALKSKLGILILRPQVESKMAVYNTSAVTWTKFRFIGPVIFDMTRPAQNEFWSKHGPLMMHLEINNRAMTLTGLVEILARCPKLEFFKCNWTPEMYSFNSELIKKYYGIHFNNGTFAHLKDLTIECSSSLTDSALWSILKWCGGSIRSLTLSSPPDEDVLTRLKPRWSVESIKNYFERFGYTGNLQYLDFSWSNLTPEDIKSLASIDMNLRGITLNYCKLDDDALRKLLLKHGETLEIFKIEGTSFTDAIFYKEILPKVKILHIGGVKGAVKSLSFLAEMPYLEELSCHKTQWLDHNMILRPLNSKSRRIYMKSLDLGGGIKHSGNKKLDPNLNKTWFSDFTGLISNIRELNLSQWSLFGTNLNFRNICHTLSLLEKLVLREWEQLSDIGTTGLYEEEIHQDWGQRMPSRPRIFIGLLKRLKVLDLSGTAITDASVNLALYSLKNLRSLAIDGTRVTDTGLRGLITKIPSLDRVSVTKCTGITISQSRLKRSDGRIVFFGKI